MCILFVYSSEALPLLQLFVHRLSLGVTKYLQITGQRLVQSGTVIDLEHVVAHNPTVSVVLLLGIDSNSVTCGLNIEHVRVVCVGGTVVNSARVRCYPFDYASGNCKAVINRVIEEIFEKEVVELSISQFKINVHVLPSVCSALEICDTGEFYRKVKVFGIVKRKLLGLVFTKSKHLVYPCDELSETYLKNISKFILDEKCAIILQIGQSDSSSFNFFSSSNELYGIMNLNNSNLVIDIIAEKPKSRFIGAQFLASGSSDEEFLLNECLRSLSMKESPFSDADVKTFPKSYDLMASSEKIINVSESHIQKLFEKLKKYKSQLPERTRDLNNVIKEIEAIADICRAPQLRNVKDQILQLKT